MSDGKSKQALWFRILVGVLALTFVLTGGSKLASVPPSPENFIRWGFSMHFMYLIGAVEVLGGLALLLRPTTFFAAIILSGTMLGAIRTGIVFHETMHILLPAVLLILLAVVILRRRDAIGLRS